MTDTTQTKFTSNTMSLDDMKDRLNDLWIQYLDFLDRYDKAQKELSTHLSSVSNSLLSCCLSQTFDNRQGFFSLAQANFKSPDHIRYGQDYYDERMQASRLASVSVDDDGYAKIQSIARAEAQSEDATTGHSDRVEDKQQPTPPGTPPAETATRPDDEKDAAKEAEAEKPVKAEQTVKDPIKWFGVLVPPQLRSCQSSFISAVEGPVCEATNAARAMRTTEVAIRKLRKDIKKAEKGAKEASVAS